MSIGNTDPEFLRWHWLSFPIWVQVLFMAMLRDWNSLLDDLPQELGMRSASLLVARISLQFSIPLTMASFWGMEPWSSGLPGWMLEHYSIPWTWIFGILQCSVLLFNIYIKLLLWEAPSVGNLNSVPAITAWTQHSSGKQQRTGRTSSSSHTALPPLPSYSTSYIVEAKMEA